MKSFSLFLLGLYSSFVLAQSDIISLGTLPQEIWETSGLLFYNGKLITHNDSGNAAELYEIDIETRAITRIIRILNAQNTDWEDLSQDSEFIYIGDIGNNSGDRQDLSVLRISKLEFDTSNEVNAETINFFYEDQVDFATTADSDYDAEALFVLGENLIILTKQWQSEGTVAYKIPKLPGTFLGEKMDTYQVNGLVTGATYDSNSETLFLVGYSQLLAPFFAEVQEVNTNAIFQGNTSKTSLDIVPTQVEALTFDGDVFYATSEEFQNPLFNSEAQLFQFSKDGQLSEEPEPVDQSESDAELVVFKVPRGSEVNYILNSNKPIFGMGIFDMQGKMIVYTPLENISDDPIDISNLNHGIYHLAFFYGNEVLSSSFLRD